MQKKILIPLVLILAVSGVTLGASFLNPNHLPDTAEFPRIPMGAGTIGEAIGKLLGTTDLGNYGGNGTVSNTLTLSGVTGTGYLKNNPCSSLKVWTGFDATGKAICGNKSATLAYYGKISEQTGTAKIYRADGTSLDAALGTPLNAGDIIKTDGSSSITIAFIDTSILRLDANTTASLDVSTNSTEPNKQIASLIVESGQIWGRILSPDTPTSTGYSLGTSDVVAGVRGTSIAIYKGGAGSNPTLNTTTNKWVLTSVSAPTDIAVVHSRLPANNSTGVAMLTMRDGTKKIMNPGEKIRYDSTKANPLNPLLTAGDPTNITSLYGTVWIRDNTKKDLDYMTNLSGSAIPTALGSQNMYNLVSNILPSEKLNSTPSLSTEKDALCATAGFTFWNSLIGTRYTDKCQSGFAIADFTKSKNEPMYTQNTTFNTSTVGLGDNSFGANSPQNDYQNGYKIEMDGEYIQYNDTALLNQLSGKTITLTLSGVIGSTPTQGTNGLVKSLPQTKFVIFDGGNGIQLLRTVSGAYQCKWNSGPIFDCGPSLTKSPDEQTISIQIPSTPQLSQFIIGNTTSPSASFPIGTIIKKISIK